MKNFTRLAQNVDVLPLLLEVQMQPHLWDEHPVRLHPKGPHRETHDIWLRYNDEAQFKASGDYSKFNDGHDPIWYPGYYALPSARRLIFDLMARVCGERLGAVLIYKVPPGAKILPHVDTGWHVGYFDKFNIALQSEPGCVFVYPKDEEVMRAVTGDCYWFRNDVPHAVENQSKNDQIILTVCIRTHRPPKPEAARATA